MTDEQVFFTTVEAARYLRLSHSTLKRYRVTGEGPVYSRMGGRVRYRREHLDAWAAERERVSTVDDGTAERPGPALRVAGVAALAAVALLAGPETALATTDTTFDSPLDTVEGIVGGTGGPLAAPAAAMQILDAADHAEPAAENSATNVNRIALAGDRIATVLRAPDGFAVEHDARSGDRYLRPSAPAAAGDAARGPVALLIGSEKGFACRLTLTRSHHGSTQIPIRNARASGRRAAPDSSRRDSRSGVWGIGRNVESRRFSASD